MKQHRILYILTMPNNNAWNGRWSGEGNLYCRVRVYPAKKDMTNIKAKTSHYYNFGDGWGANVMISEIDAKEGIRYIKASKGFCGYDWMIDEIEKHGRILSRQERIDARANQCVT